MPAFSKPFNPTSRPATPSNMPPASNDGTTQPAAVPDGRRSPFRRFFHRGSSRSRGSSPTPDASVIQAADNIAVPSAQLAHNVQVLGPADSGATADPEGIVAADFASMTNISSMTRVPTIVVSEHNSGPDLVSITNRNIPAKSKFKDSINIALDALETALRLVKETSDWNPVLKATFGGLVAVIDLAKTVSDNWQGMKEVMDHIRGLMPVLQTSAKRLEGRQDGLGKINNLMNLAIIIENKLKKIQEMHMHGLFRRVLQGTTDAKAILDVYQNINKALEQFKNSPGDF
ncbi:hypothetical protein H0H92_003048 [Tricholoma furcatifolium]|nr:hypothetical protein H0H92_003048 [Tricholoma furcatifolium]